MSWPLGRLPGPNDWTFAQEVIGFIGVPLRQDCMLFTDLGTARDERPTSTLVWIWRAAPGHYSDIDLARFALRLHPEPTI